MTSIRAMGWDGATLRVRGWDSSSPEAGPLGGAEPLGFAAGDSNLYRYVDNDPMDQIDPTGLQSGPVRPIRSPAYDPPVADQPICDEHLNPISLRSEICSQDQIDSYMRGCIGLCTTRLGISDEWTVPQALPGVRCFTDFQDAKTFQNQLDSNKKNKKGKAVLFAVDSLAKLTSITGGLPSEVAPGFNQGSKNFDYLTELTFPNGTIVWEHGNHAFNKPGGFVIHTYLTQPAPLSQSDIQQGKTRAYWNGTKRRVSPDSARRYGVLIEVSS